MAMRSAQVDDAASLAALVDGHPLFERYGLRPAELAASLEGAIGRGEHV